MKLFRMVLFFSIIAFCSWFLSEALDEVFFYGTYNKAVAGDPVEQFRLAQLYDIGQFTIHDSEKAKEWYEKAANNGSEIAKTILCNKYEKGCTQNDGTKQETN